MYKMDQLPKNLLEIVASYRPIRRLQRYRDHLTVNPPPFNSNGFNAYYESHIRHAQGKNFIVTVNIMGNTLAAEPLVKMDNPNVDIHLTLRGDDFLSIDASEFEENLSLRTITLPQGIDHIGENAFERCINLKEIHIPAPGSPSFPSRYHP